MTSATTAISNFKMVATREVLSQVSATPAIEQQIEAIEQSVVNNPSFACDLSKAIIESTCKIILEDRGIEPDPKWDALVLLKNTLIQLPLAGASGPKVKQAREAIEKTVRGQLQTIQGICEIRNNFGLASHGKGRDLPRLGDYQVMYAAQAADAVVAFLYRVHRTNLETSPAQHAYYEDYSDFNQSLDDLYEEVVIGSLKVSPSRILYHFDIIGYRDALTDYLEQDMDAPEDDEAVEAESPEGPSE